MINWYEMAKLDPAKHSDPYKAKEKGIELFLKICGSQPVTEDEISLMLVQMGGCSSVEDARKEVKEIVGGGIYGFYPFAYFKKIQGDSGNSKYQACKGMG